MATGGVSLPEPNPDDPHPDTPTTPNSTHQTPPNSKNPRSPQRENPPKPKVLTGSDIPHDSNPHDPNPHHSTPLTTHPIPPTFASPTHPGASPRSAAGALHHPEQPFVHGCLTSRSTSPSGPDSGCNQAISPVPPQRPHGGRDLADPSAGSTDAPVHRDSGAVATRTLAHPAIGSHPVSDVTRWAPLITRRWCDKRVMGPLGHSCLSGVRCCAGGSSRCVRCRAGTGPSTSP